MSISVVIPTKNRPGELVAALRTLLLQTRLPEEIIVVDQSAEDTSESETLQLFREKSWKDQKPPRLVYVRDANIEGANAARNVGLSRSAEKYLCFIEDDILLEPQALEALLRAHEQHAEYHGVCGVITNCKMPQPVVRLYQRLFSLGPFFDERQPLYRDWRRYSPDDIVPISKMGGLISFPVDRIGDARFDESKKRLRVRGEDRDFCFTLSSKVGGGKVFAMVMGARLEHHPSPVGRHRGRPERLLVVSQHYFFDRHLRGSPVYWVAYLWWHVGIGLAASAAALKRWNVEPIESLFQGLRDIREGYVERPAQSGKETPASEFQTGVGVRGSMDGSR